MRRPIPYGICPSCKCGDWPAGHGFAAHSCYVLVADFGGQREACLSSQYVIKFYIDAGIHATSRMDWYSLQELEF